MGCIRAICVSLKTCSDWRLLGGELFFLSLLIRLRAQLQWRMKLIQRGLTCPDRFSLHRKILWIWNGGIAEGEYIIGGGRNAGGEVGKAFNNVRCT